MSNEKIKLLIVDDETQILNALERQLFKEYNVFKAINTQEAIDILRANSNIPLSIIDYNLEEEKTGIDIATILKNTYPLMQILMLTGEQSMETVISALNSGSIDAFLNKPIKTLELKTHIEENLQIWKNRKKIVDDTIEQLKSGKSITEEEIGILGTRTPILKELLKEAIEITNKTKKLECIGIGIAKNVTTLYRYFFETSFTVKNETLFAGFIESLSHLNRDLFAQSQDHTIDEIKLHDVSLHVRSIDDLNFTIFIHGEPEDKSQFDIHIDILIKELSELITQETIFLNSSLKNIIKDKLIQFSKIITT